MSSQKHPAGRRQSGQRRGPAAPVPAPVFAPMLALLGLITAAQAAAQLPSGEAGAAARSRATAALPSSVAELLSAEPLPAAEVSPSGRHLLLVHERRLLDLQRLAEPAVRLAGRRINPRTAAGHAPREYYGLTLVDLRSGELIPLVLPRGAVIGYPSFSPDGARFAFTLDAAGGVELWIGDTAEARVRPLVHSVNAALGPPCRWAPDSRRLLCARAPDPRPRRRGIEIDALIERAAQAPGVGQPTVLNPGRTAELLESRLELIDSISGQRRPLGAPAAFERAELAPSGAFVLVQRLREPYPQIEGVDDLERVVEIRSLQGDVVATLPQDARAAQWRAGEPATLLWVERQQAGDRLVQLAPPFDARADVAFEMPATFSGLYWIGDGSAALVGNYAADTGLTELWQVDLDGSTAARRLTNYRSTAGLSPVLTTNRFGQPVLQTHDGGFYLRGERRIDGTQRQVLERVGLDDGATTRVWTAEADTYEQPVAILSSDAQLILTRRETFAAAPNYFLRTTDGRGARQLTHAAHPAPQLAQARHVPLSYSRGDGVALSASLYLPPQRSADEALPLVVWSYPRNVVSESADDAAIGPMRFVSFERAFRLFFLLRGYAVLDDVSMPIIGELSEANDTFIDQIVANADAAVRAAVDTGNIDARRVGVAGHSYGAFMVANLLAHSQLFSAGVAMSGAYNRTLTPFGFQTERRTLWEAPETYLAMSPLLYSHQIEAPLLLIHGLNDDNAGTSPLQSTQFYSAIRGNGGDVEILLLPWEGHSYRARKSVLDAAATMLEWFDRHLGTPPPQLAAQKETGASLRPLQ